MMEQKNQYNVKKYDEQHYELRQNNLNELSDVIHELQERKPLIHMIPNGVTQSFCADGMAAIGARPVMATSPLEMEDIVSSANSLVVNMGQPDETKFVAAKVAISTANKKRIPVLFDPVGIGASKYRKENMNELIRLPFRGVIKGNYSEMMTIAKNILDYNGVDNSISTELADCDLQALQELLLTPEFEHKIFALTGVKDYIITPDTILTLAKKTPSVNQIVGMGCLSGAIIGCFLSVTDMKKATLLGLTLTSGAMIYASQKTSFYGDMKCEVLNYLSRRNIFGFDLKEWSYNEHNKQ